MDNLPQRTNTPPSAAQLLKLTPSTTGSLTLAQATSPDAYPIRRLLREHGEAVAAMWISDVLTEADALCGGKNPPHVLAAFGRMALAEFQHRSVQSLVLAVKEGLCRKVYGALTWPQIAEWLSDHEAKVVALAEWEGTAPLHGGQPRGRLFGPARVPE